MAVHTYIFTTVDRCKSEQESGHWRQAYTSLLLHGVASMRSPADGQLAIFGKPLVIDAGGQVSGFRDVVGALHRHVGSMLLAEWSLMHDAGLVSSSIDRDSLALSDVASFLLTVARQSTLQDPTA